jgi:stage III sporulation protein SpoIIIAA
VGGCRHNVAPGCRCSHLVTSACSNEIAGDGRVPHRCIGSSRRVMVQQREQQHEVLLEAVQNLNPDVVICDEIGTLKVGSCTLELCANCPGA